MGVFPVPIRPPGALSGHLCDPCHICASLLLPLVLADVSAGIAWGLASACPRCTLCCFGTAQQGVCLYCPTAASGLGWSCCPGFMFVVQRGQRSSAFTRTCVWLPNVNTHTRKEEASKLHGTCMEGCMACVTDRFDNTNSISLSSGHESPHKRGAHELLYMIACAC